MKKSARSASSLLFGEHPLIFSPKLATDHGLHEAIVLQQIHFLLQMESSGRVINGEKWVWNTLESWQREHFPFFSPRTLRRAIESLERHGLLVSCQPEGRVSRMKYYRINYKSLHANSRCGQNGQIDVAKMDRSEAAKMDSSLYTETTAETTLSKEPKETAFSAKDAAILDSPDFAATWLRSEKRDMTKEQLLAKIKPRTDPPSENEFNDYLESEGCTTVLDHRDLYLELSNQKWHQWNDHRKRWVKIRDWKKYVVPLEQIIQKAKCRG